jgi:hypothetical protein
MIDVHGYCRDVEAYLCRRNGGHLIRLVGPAFDVVKRWATDGIPLGVVQEGIDSAAERSARRTTTRRRPLRIEFCEADVLEGFDRWRRAVGMTAPSSAAESPAAARGTLAAHIDRVAVHLTNHLLNGTPGHAVRAAVETVLAQVSTLGATARSARGAARDALITALAELDRELLASAEADLGPDRLATCVTEAERELEPFRIRLGESGWTTALAAARTRAVRRASGLPDLRFD